MKEENPKAIEQRTRARNRLINKLATATPKAQINIRKKMSKAAENEIKNETQFASKHKVNNAAESSN